MNCKKVPKKKYMDSKIIDPILNIKRKDDKDRETGA